MKQALVSNSSQRSGALTTAYDATPTCIPCNTQNQSVVLLNFVKQSSGGAIVKIEYSFDTIPQQTTAGASQTLLQSLTYYRKCLLDVANQAAGTNTQDTQVKLKTLEVNLTDTDKYLFEIPLLATAVRVNAKAVSANSGTLAISVVTGVA